jgi:hypothetical protein
MKFVKIGRHIFNIAQITRIEVHDGGDLNVWFVGSEKLNLYEPESTALIACLNATEIHLSSSPR